MLAPLKAAKDKAVATAAAANAQSQGNSARAAEMIAELSAREVEAVEVAKEKQLEEEREDARVQRELAKASELGLDSSSEEEPDEEVAKKKRKAKAEELKKRTTAWGGVKSDLPEKVRGSAKGGVGTFFRLAAAERRGRVGGASLDSTPVAPLPISTSFNNAISPRLDPSPPPRSPPPRFPPPPPPPPPRPPPPPFPPPPVP